MKKTLLTILLLFVANIANATPKYVFFFIGDGFGISHRQVAEYYKNHVLNNKTPLTMNTFEEIAIYKTESYNSLVTDSASSATAMASGVKTHNGVIGQDHNQKNTESIAEKLAKKGLSIGIVTSTRITHATPAGFSSHVEHRDNENEIALQQVNSKHVQFFAGGGLRHFVPNNSKITKSKRNDDKNLLEVAKQNGFTVILDNKGNLVQQAKNANKVLALLAPSHLPYVLDNSKTPNIPKLTEMAIANLSKNKNGFFLMVEGGRIDHAAHANDIKSVITEVLEFDEAIKVAYDFYKKYPEDTLIIVGSDHETGGLGLGQGVDYLLTLNNIKPIKASSEDVVNGKYKQLKGDRKAYLNFLKNEVGLSKLTKEEKAILEEAMDFEDKNPKYNYKEKYTAIEYGYGSPVASAVSHIISRRAGVYWTTFAHTAEPVALAAIGNGALEFKAYFDNTDIPKTLSKIMGLGSNEKQSYKGASHIKPFKEGDIRK